MEQSPLAFEILKELGRYEASRHIEIGGGICLWHYLPYRRTNDLDAWWVEPNQEAISAIDRSLTAVADEHEFEMSHRTQGSYQSWDLKNQRKTVFAFQIARKVSRIEPTLESPWGYLKLESFRENIANKMTALVQRGAPRDMLDISQVMTRGLLSARECWRLWREKNPSQDLEEAQSSILKYLNALEARRPLTSVEDPGERKAAWATRMSIRQFAEEAPLHGN